MSTLLVSGAGAGSQGSFGTASVVNAAQGAFAVGFSSYALGIARVSFDVLGNSVLLDLTVAKSQLGSNVRLDFDTAQPATGAGVGSAIAFGSHGIANVAQGAFASGFDAVGFGIATRVTRDVEARELALDLTVSFTQPGTNVGLYFGGKPLVAGVTLGAWETIPSTHLIYNNARLLYPTGFQNPQVWGIPFAARGNPVNFDLTVAVEAVNPVSARLDFSANRPVMAAGGIAEWAIGTPTLTNVAQGAFEQGWESVTFGYARLSGWAISRNLLLDFLDSYAPDTGQNVAFAFGELKTSLPQGWDSQAFGTPVAGTDGKLYPTGIYRAPLWGTHRVENSQRFIEPPSLTVSTALGVPNATRIEPPANQGVTTTGKIDGEFGTAFLSGGVRTIDLTDAAPIEGGYGTALIAYAIRFVEVPWSFFLTFGQTAIDTTHYVYPVGFDAIEWGDSFTHDQTQTVENIGGDSFTEFGEAELTRSPRILFASGFRTALEAANPSERWGSPILWNRNQIVEQLFSPGPEDGGAFGSYISWFVENRNRVMAAYGHIDSRFPYTHLIDLTGRALLVAGFDAFDEGRAWNEKSLIAYANRNVAPEPIEPGFVSHWVVVQKTPQIFPDGIPSEEAFGQPEVVNTRRYYGWIGGIDSLEVGTAFVDFGVRYIEQYWPWEGRYGEPTVWLYTRSLEPPSVVTDGFGLTVVEEHFTIINPSWATRETPFGTETRIQNVTPQLWTFGAVQTEWGASGIHNEWTAYEIQGWDSSEVSREAVIKDRAQTVPVPTFNVIQFGANTQINNLIADQPTNRTIFPPSFETLAFGADTHTNANTIYPGGFVATQFGQAVFSAMSLFPSGFRDFDKFGIPGLNATQWILLSSPILNNRGAEIGTFSGGIPSPVDLAADDPLHRLSPWTIWCHETPPAQAYANHLPHQNYDQMDYWLHTETSDRPVFGRPWVANANRTVFHYHNDNGSEIIGETFGNLEAANRRRWLSPAGIKPPPRAFPKLNRFGELDLERQGRDYLEFGDGTAIDFPAGPYTRSIIPQGISGAFGATHIDLFNRELTQKPWASWVFGQARIHPPEPIIPPGLAATLFGDTMIDFKIRHVTPEGFDSFIAQESLGFFKDRMRVQRTTP